MADARSSPNPPRRRWRRRLAALLALAVGTALAVVGLEFLLRATNLFGVNYEAEFQRYRLECLQYLWDRADGTRDLDGVLYRHKPGLDVDLGSFRLRTNALGLRGPEIAVPKPADTFRILVLGDSVAFGWGVDDEVTFLRRWEAQLNARGDGRRYQVVNTGHLLFDTTQEAALLRDFGLGLQPDAVLLVYVVNDVEPTWEVVAAALGMPVPATAEEQALAEPDGWQRLAARLRPRLPAIAALVATFSDQGARYAEILAERGGVYAPEQIGRGVRGWERSKAALLTIRDLCRGTGVPLLVLDHSYPPIRSLPPFCREHDIPVAEFTFTDSELQQPIYNSRIDTHANAFGHGLLLEKLERAVAAAGWLGG